ncbi:metalloregulator ArsR/SmtB family transcription factor [Paracoccus tegillarcae]|uniref:ArsR family transcriptional regulator n=1 Tax=Paracoccus tegillarcae TaxID=1529068 RepID=A0A2K9ERN8_9RHOB|nr:metalloregulator ArsR/SmtB family transcription factor [Paracoccus tegillarcae]AUH33456.1 ArsR family transcriptional regulator [Paracoccus tegillarcae]
MESKDALDCFASLSQATRLDVFRLLVRSGGDGMTAGEIAQTLDVRDNTLSTNLSILSNAGLVARRREGRRIRYFADLTTMRHLVDYLLSDCCGGSPDKCRPAINSLITAFDSARWQQSRMPDEPFNVLFLCTANSARSLIAEAVLNADPSGRFRAYSAGSQPSGQPHPRTLQLLGRLAHDPGDIRSKSWDEFDGPDAARMDFVFTVCDNAAGEVCPVWPGNPITAHWGMPDPAAASGTEAQQAAAFDATHKILAARMSAFTSLPIASLDRAALQAKVDDIGKQPEPTTAS